MAEPKTKSRGWMPVKELFELIHTGEELAKTSNDPELQALVNSVLSIAVIGCRNRFIRPTQGQTQLIEELADKLYNR